MQPIHPKRTGRSIVAAALLTLAALSAGRLRADPPAVLSELPADAKAVVVINNVKDLGAKINNVAVRLNLPAPPDLVGYATRLAGIVKGFDANSSAALVLLAPSKEQEEEATAPPAVVLLPTTDAKAMLESFEPAAPDKSGISEVTLPGDRGEKGYSATVDKWVVLAQDKAALESYLKHKDNLAKTLPLQTLKTFEKNDLVVWANIPAVSKGADKVLEDRQQEMAGMLDLANLNNNQSPLTSAMQKAVVNESFIAAKQYMKDADAGMLTLRLSDAGITLGLIGTFKPDSPFGKFVTAQKPAHLLSLEGLPAGDLLMAGALTWNGPSLAKLIGDVGDQILSDEVIAKDPKANDLKSLVDLYRQGATLTTGERFVMLAPAAHPAQGAAPAKTGFLSGAFIIDSAEPAKVMALSLEALRNPVTRNSMNVDIQQNVTVTPDAVTVKGAKFTKIQMTFKLREEAAGADKPVSEMAKQQFQMIQMMYGADGMTMYSGVVAKRCLMVMGAENLDSAVAAAESNSNELSNNPMISAAKDQIASDPVAVGYIDMGRWITLMQPLIMSAIMQGAAPPPAPAVAPAAAPLVMSAGFSDSTLTLEMHVPTNTIVSVKDTMQRMFAPGQAPGAPGGAVQP